MSIVCVLTRSLRFGRVICQSILRSMFLLRCFPVFCGTRPLRILHFTLAPQPNPVYNNLTDRRIQKQAKGETNVKKTFKVPMMKEWTLLDDRIVVGGKKEILFSDVIRIDCGEPTSKRGNGVIQLWVSGKSLPHMVCYTYADKEEGKAAADFIERKYLELHKDIVDEVTKEHRMRCNVCGNIFCYNGVDVYQNEQRIKLSESNAKSGLFNAFFGNSVDTQAFIDRAERNMEKVKDFTRCPKCNSSDLTEIDDNAPAIPASPVAPASAVSAADELKKFKELLDMGILTQEEFDAKKKQLLGL
jgi:hypothetical protein